MNMNMEVVVSLTWTLFYSAGHSHSQHMRLCEDGLFVRVLDSWSNGCEFESWQERR